MDLENIKKLVKDLKKLNFQPVRVRQNFFDICGYPHYENVMSNVIVYFLNNSTFRQLFLNAILKCLKINDQEQLIADAEREVATNDGKRIDILIKTKNYVIAIENKVYTSDESQSYDSYRKYLQENFADKEEQNKRLVLLSMFQDETKSDCKLDGCIKYQDFLREIRNNIGTYISNASLEEMVLLRHFINNLENIMGNNLNINSEECKELLKNNEIISDAFTQLYKCKDNIAIKFRETLIKNYNAEIERPYRSADHLGISEELFLKEFTDKYGKIYICLWMSDKVCRIALAFKKDRLKPNVQIKNFPNQKEEDGFTIILPEKEYKYEEELINIDRCIKDADELIKEFKEKQSEYFTEK